MSQRKDEPIEYAKIRYNKAFNKAKLDNETDREMSIRNLERSMVMHKFNHAKYDPKFMEEQNRAAIIAILSKEQDLREHQKAIELRKSAGIW